MSKRRLPALFEPGRSSCPRRQRVAIAAVALLALAAAGCGGDAPPGAAEGEATLPPHTVPELAPIPAPADVPAEPATAPEPTPTTTDSRADATHTLPDVPILRALRVGEQPGADRIVFEFDGDGLPAWSISYVDRPVYECGSGHVVRLPGDAWLQVRFMGAQAHTAQGESTTGPKLRAFGMTNLVALARVCDFEGEVTWVAAVKRPAGYTPRVLDAPARLAVDLAH